MSRTRPISVTDFGAIGDGVTVNDAAFAAALAVFNAAEGQILEIPFGTFKITQPLTITRMGTIRGEHSIASSISYAGTANPILTLADSIASFVLHDLHVDNTGQATIGVLIQGSRVFVERLYAQPTVAFSTAIVATHLTATVNHVVIRDAQLSSKERGQENPIGVWMARGRGIALQSCFLSGHLTAIKIGTDAATVEGATVRDCLIDAYSGTTLIGYPGAEDAIGIDVRWADSLLVHGTTFQMAGDEVSEAGAQRAIRTTEVNGGLIQANHFGANGQLTAGISITSPDTQGLQIKDNTFQRFNGYGVENLIASDGATFEMDGNYAPAPTSGVWSGQPS